MYFVEILVWFFFPDFQFAMIAFNSETSVWYHTFDQYFRCISIVCKNYFYHSLFHTKNHRKLEQTSHFHHICIYPRLESVRQFRLSKIAVSNMKKYFGPFAKIAPYLTSYSAKVQIDIYILSYGNSSTK